MPLPLIDTAYYINLLKEANERLDAYHSAVQNARAQGLLVPTVIEIADASAFPQEEGK